MGIPSPLSWHALGIPQSAVIRASRLTVLAAFLAAVGARTQLVVVGPVLPEMTIDLDISHAVAGLLIALPVFLMAVVAIPSASLGHRFGTRLAIGISLAALALAGIARPLAPNALGILLFTVPIGLAVGVIGVILPSYVKEEVADIPARATGAYVTAMLVGASLAGTLAVPIAAWGGTWRTPLLVFGLVALLPLIGWFALVRRGRTFTAEPGRPPKLPWRSRVAWLLVAAFCFQSLVFYGLITWLAPALIESGSSAVAAGSIVGLFLIAGIPGTLMVTWLGDRLPSRRVGLFASAVAFLIGVIGFTVLPDFAVVWAVIAGIGSAANFAMVMTLPLDAATRPAEVGSYSALMLGGGYLIASAAPTILGATRDLTGSFSMTMWLLVVATALLVVVSVLASPERLRHHEALPAAANV